MSTPSRGSGPTPRSHRPRALPVFIAAFVAGAAAAVGLNRTLEVHLAQSKPQIEQEPIFVALRPLPQGSPVTVWDVALREWPKAMLPSTAMRATDSFDGLVVRYPLREGQPVLSVQLARASAAPAGVYAAQVPQSVASPAAVPVQQVPPPAVMPQPDVVDPARPAAAADLWTPAEQAATQPAAPPADRPASDRLSPPASPGPAATVAATPASAAPTTTAPTSTDIDVPAAGDTRPTAASKHKDPVVRYLVVPEQIAAQADRSFVTPRQAPEAAKPATRTATTPTSAPTQTATARTATARTGTAKAATTRTATTQQPATNGGVAKPAQSSARPQAGRGRAAAPQPQQRPRQAPAQPAGQAAQTGSRVDAMFPNLAAGLDAVELELRRIRRERGRLAEESDASNRTAAVATQPQAATPTRSAVTPPNRSAGQPQR